MEGKIWLARLSEGWCPRPEHGRLAGDSGCFCVPCCAKWSIEDNMPVANLQKILTAEQPSRVFLVPENEDAIGAIDRNAQDQARAAAKTYNTYYQERY